MVMLKVAMMCGPIAYTVALSNALSRYCLIDLYCGRRSAGGEDPSIFSGLAENVTPILYDEYRKRDPRNAIAHFKLCRMLRRGSYDLIHLQHEWEWAAMLFYPLIRETPLIFTVHDPIQHAGRPKALVLYMDMLQAFFIRKARRLIVHGTTMRRSLLARYPHVKPERVICHLHGDPSIRSESGSCEAPEPSSENIILFFGNIRPNKGLPYLIQAEPLIAGRVRDFRIHIIGRCLDHSYKKFIVDRGRYMIYEEFLPHTAVPWIFTAASVVVLPYISATQTGVIPLAYAYRRPVVASSIGGIVDVVEHGVTGLLVEPRNVPALADAICTLLTDRVLAGRMGREGYAFAQRRLSWDVSARVTIAMYESVVAEASHGR
jgi:glycosyltransferase involved in cell wall biosynthesis